MFRARDVAALLAALLLTRMAWNDSTESLQASAHLAFYFPRDKATVVSPMDLDGDGTNEALAVIQRAQHEQVWEWKILDLKALAPKRGAGSGATSKLSPSSALASTTLPPFQPPVLFSAKDTEARDSTVTPIQMTTGQVLVKPTRGRFRRSKLDLSRVAGDTEINERNRHYFCGIDWHDASQQCSHPCPSGQASECPDDRRCYADTPCDIEEQQKREETQVLFELTPGGGLPSVVTLWSDGVLALSSLTKDVKARSQDLELKSMWNVQLLPETISHAKNILWVESNILFLDAYDSSEALKAETGMVVVSGIYVDEGAVQATVDDEVDEKGGGGEDTTGPKQPLAQNHFLIAVDAMKGKILWDTFTDDQKHKEPVPLPLARGLTSYARRRSRLPILKGGDHASPDTHPENLPNCQVTFRHHLKHVLPYAYWTSKDSHLAALHLDQSKKPPHHYQKDQRHPATIGKDTPPKLANTAASQHQKKWHHRFHKPKHATAVKGRPNVIVTQTKGGMQIRSLRNGRPLCHMSLLEETLYTDLNNDGGIDQVQILLQNKKVDQTDKWVRSILAKLQNSKEAASSKRQMSQLMSDWDKHLCHAMALSGMPAREALFSTSLCGSAHEGVMVHPSVDLDSVAPVVVESLSGRRNTRDIVVALNNGMVHRLQGRSGRKEWTVVGRHHENFPTWEESSTEHAVLTRLQSMHIPAPLRPILLAGENSLAVISVKTGQLLATASFPQLSNARPILAEVSGDGTTDLIVLSIDGIWGFQIQVRTGSPIVLRILVGLLLFGLMLAILRNRFAQRKDVRATDP